MYSSAGTLTAAALRHAAMVQCVAQVSALTAQEIRAHSTEQSVVVVTTTTDTAMRAAAFAMSPLV